MTKEYLDCLKAQERILLEQIAFNKNYKIPINRKKTKALKWIQEQIANIK